MSHWIKVVEQVDMTNSRGSNQSKTSIKGSNLMLVSKRVKVHGSPKLAEGGKNPVPKGFANACEKAEIPKTRRQLSKYLRKRGLAYANRK